eukprot:462174_1
MDESDGAPSLNRTWALLNFEQINRREKVVNFEIRMNFTVIPNTRMVVTNTRVELPGLDRDFLLYFSSGFLSIEQSVTAFLLKPEDGGSVVSGTSDGSVVSRPLMAAAFPTPAFDQNEFYGAIGNLAGFIMAMAMMYPCSQLLKGIVEEKESRTKETMNMMGLKSWICWLSWFLTYLAIFTTVSALGALMLTVSVFGRSSALLLFLLLFAFVLSLLALNMLLSVFFSRAKLAAIMGPL